MNPFGNFVVNLLMLALGLGSFKIALGAIFSGVAQGASSATFPFATKPLGFMLVTGAWLGLGFLMLLAAWRGVAGPHQDSGPDDAQDEHPTVPQPRQAARTPQADPLPPITQGVRQAQQGGTSSFDQFIQRARQPATVASRPQVAAQQHASTSLPESRQSTPKNVQLPEPLHLYKSRFYAGSWLVIMTIYTVAVGFGAVVLSGVLGQKLAIFIFALSFAVSLLIAVKCVRDLRWTGPALSLEKYGITDHVHGSRHIPWTDIQGVRLSSPSATTFLVLQFARADQVQAYFGSTSLPQAAIQRIFYNGFEARMALTSLSFKRAEVMQVSQAFLRHARRP